MIRVKESLKKKQEAPYFTVRQNHLFNNKHYFMKLMTYNSTHTALLVLCAIVIAAFHYSVDLSALIPVIAPIGAYITLRERSRISSALGGDSSRPGDTTLLE